MEFEIFRILYRLNHLDFYFVLYHCNLITVLELHFTQVAKAYFKPFCLLTKVYFKPSVTCISSLTPCMYRPAILTDNLSCSVANNLSKSLASYMDSMSRELSTIPVSTYVVKVHIKGYVAVTTDAR